MTEKFETVDQYVAAQPAEVQKILETIRERMSKLFPGSEQVISYQIPTVKIEGKSVVYFAAWKSHISLYPVHPLSEPVESQISQYRSGKDTVRIPLEGPIPYDLIDQIALAVFERHQGEAG